MTGTNRTDPDGQTDALGGERPVEGGSFRDRVRGKRGLGHAWRVGVFVVGLLCVVAGFALAVFPGPLTIPPVLLGLWIWSTEFEWAHRFFTSFKEKGNAAWEHAKRHPVSSTIVTVGGLAMAGVAIWAVSHYHLVDKAKEYVGGG